MIALTIDEDGMALTAEKKVAIAKRIYDLATKKYGIRPAGPDFRCADFADLDRAGGVPLGGDGDAGGGEAASSRNCRT